MMNIVLQILAVCAIAWLIANFLVTFVEAYLWILEDDNDDD